MNSPLTGEQLFGTLPITHALSNGLDIFFAPEHTGSVVSVQAWVKTGSIHEGDLLGSGLSHYLEHMVFKGTKKFHCREIARNIQRAGAAINAYTAFDHTVYHVDGPAECTDTALEILADMLFHPLIKDDDATRERDVILREIAMRDDDPDSVLAEAALAGAFHTHPCHLPVIGLRDAFASLTPEQLRTYHKARYVPNNIVLAIAGALEPETLFSLVEKHFGSQPASALGNPYIPTEPLQLAPRHLTLRNDNVQVLRGCALWRIPGIRHPDSPALDIFSMLLGRGESSRLYRKLRDELGLVHEIDAANWSPSDHGILWTSYTADTGKRGEIETAITTLVKSILNEGFRENEFAKARRACLVAFLDSRSTVSGLASQLGAQTVIIGDPGYPRLYFDRVQNLTPENVIQAALRHIRPEFLTLCAMEPPPAATATTAATTTARRPILFEKIRLANGLRVLLQPVSGHPKIHFRAVLPGGGEAEPPTLRGLGALLATLMTRDTENHSASQVAEITETLGAPLCETAGNNSIALSIEALQPDCEQVAKLLADALLRPSLLEKTFFRERAAQRASLTEEDDDITAYGTRRLRELFFGQRPLAAAPLGRIEDLDEMLPSDARALHACLAKPENCVLAVSGDFDRDTLLPILKKQFGVWHGASPALPRPTTSPPAPVPTATAPATTGRVDEKRTAEQAVVFLAFPDVGIVHEEYVTGQLLDELMSSMAGRLFTIIREEKSMAYFVGARRLNSRHEGMFYLYAGTSPTHAEAVLDAMREEVARARNGSFTTEEIAAAKTCLRTARRLSSQKMGNRAMNAALNALYDLDPNLDSWWESHLAAQNNASLAAFAQKYLRDDASLAYVLSPKTK
ncbi:MAG: insulinase family protein [Puniceicoccales bacterium]|jgi:zinc protease|nr:insulinase family protein [Puniceicoccales bacterium]